MCCRIRAKPGRVRVDVGRHRTQCVVDSGRMSAEFGPPPNLGTIVPNSAGSAEFRAAFDHMKAGASGKCGGCFDLGTTLLATRKAHRNKKPGAVPKSGATAVQNVATKRAPKGLDLDENGWRRSGLSRYRKGTYPAAAQASMRPARGAALALAMRRRAHHATERHRARTAKQESGGVTLHVGIPTDHQSRGPHVPHARCATFYGRCTFAEVRFGQNLAKSGPSLAGRIWQKSDHTRSKSFGRFRTLADSGRSVPHLAMGGLKSTAFAPISGGHGQLRTISAGVGPIGTTFGSQVLHTLSRRFRIWALRANAQATLWSTHRS